MGLFSVGCGNFNLCSIFSSGAPFYPRYVNMGPAEIAEEDTTGNTIDNTLSAVKANQVVNNMLIFMNADPLTKIAMEMVSHSLGSFDVSACCVAVLLLA